jgi:hypothetical protein
MVFKPKYKHSKETKHLRIPVEYKDLVIELLLAIDKKFDIERGRHFMRRMIDNLS